jgi:hypothetical protein
VAGGIILHPAAAAVAEDLLLGQLLAGPGLGGPGRPGLGGEAEPAEGGHGGDNPQEVSPADPNRLETLGEEVELGFRNAHQGNPHD